VHFTILYVSVTHLRNSVTHLRKQSKAPVRFCGYPQKRTFEKQDCFSTGSFLRLSAKTYFRKTGLFSYIIFHVSVSVSIRKNLPWKTVKSTGSFLRLSAKTYFRKTVLFPNIYFFLFSVGLTSARMSSSLRILMARLQPGRLTSSTFYGDGNRHYPKKFSRSGFLGTC
jgi:hypothetical protein